MEQRSRIATIPGLALTLLAAVVLVMGLSYFAVKAFSTDIYMQAAEAGNSSLVRLFIKLGYSADHRDSWNGGPLFYAATNGRLELVKELVEIHKVDINSRYRMDKTALMGAAQNGHLEVVEYLVSNGATTSLRDSENKTALDHAIENGHSNVIRLLSDEVSME